MNKTAIVVLSDPKAGDEALGRVFNALAAVWDFKQKKQDVKLVFQGAGTRWTSVLSDPAHPAHALFEDVRDRVEGVSCGCADVFGAREDAEKNGFDLITESPLPGTSGVPSLARWISDGYQVVTF